MALNKKEKIEVLLESFEVLINDIDKNKHRIKETIIKMAKFDIKVAISIWEEMLTKNNKVIALGDSSSTLHWAVAYGIEEVLGKESIYNIIKDNVNIKKALYGVAESIYTTGIEYAILHKDLNDANEMLELLYKNKNSENPFDEDLEDIVDYIVSEFDDDEAMSNDIAEFLIEWANKVKNKDIKAKMKVSLIDYI